MNKYSSTKGNHVMTGEKKINQSSVALSFSRAAQRYDAAAVLQQEIGRRLIGRLDFVKINVETIMDLGASTGYFIQPLNERYVGTKILAVDIAEGMLRYMQVRADTFEQVDFVCADAQYLPFASKTVDLVFSNLMLQWCPDVIRVFKEVQRVLKPGGLFIFSTLGPDTLYELRHSWSQVDAYQHVNQFIDMHDLGDALLASDLQDPVMDMEYMTVTYSKVDGLLRDLRDLGANQVVGNRRLGLLGRGHYQAFVEAYEHFRDENGVLPATYEIIYGHAWGAAEENETSIFVRDIKWRRDSERRP